MIASPSSSQSQPTTYAPQPYQQQFKKSHKNRNLGIVAVVIILVIIIAAAANQSNPSRISANTTLIASGTSYIISPASDEHASFATSVNGNVTGAFTTDGFVAFYVLTQSQYNSYASGDTLSDGAPKNYVYHVNAVTSTTTTVSFNTALPTGSYYLLFFRSSSFYTSVTVTISQSITFMPT